MNRFDECLEVLLQNEGGYSDRPNDRGGPTNKGVTQRIYDAYRRKQLLPLQPVRFIDSVEVREIYFDFFWTPARCDQLPVPVDLMVFDCAANSSVSRASIILQQCVGEKEDGIIGRNTLASVAAHHDPYELARHYLEHRQHWYDEIVARDETQRANEHGWRNRLCGLRMLVDNMEAGLV